MALGYTFAAARRRACTHAGDFVERAAALERKNQQTDTADSAPVREALHSCFDMVSRGGRFEGFGECGVRGAVCAVSAKMRHFDFSGGE